jgi:hypothetical protein
LRVSRPDRPDFTPSDRVSSCRRGRMPSPFENGTVTRSKEEVLMTRSLGHRQPRAIGSPPTWRAALTFLRTYLGKSAAAFAAELGARCAINHLRSLDDDRLRDLGLEREDVDHFVRFRRD